MKKTKINLDILLPEVPDERDACVNRIIQALSDESGIEKIHIIPETEETKAQLCFHFDPEKISLQKVEKLATIAGANITERYGHLLLDVKGIRHVRHARLIETSLRTLDGILSVSVSAADWISIEFDKRLISAKKIYARLNGLGNEVISPGLTAVVHKHKHEEEAPEGNEKQIHEDQHHQEETQGHHHGGMFGEKTELVFALICGAFLAIGFSLSFIKSISTVVSITFCIGAYLFGGFYTTKEAVQSITKGRFEIDFLMLVAAVGAAALGEWMEGSLLLFLFSLGHSLEHFAMEKARKSIAALASLAPKTALLKSGGDVKEVKIEELKKGDIILVKPNSKIAADGFIVKGSSTVNQAPITGESVPVDKKAVTDANISLGSAGKLDAVFNVFAGSINGANTLEIKVTRIAADSTIARLVKMVNEAETQKSPTQNFTNKIEKYYVPSVLGLVVLLLFAFLVINEPFSASFYRAMAVLVAASPCALAISTPSAVLSGVARAAKGGVLIKGGKPLEELGSLTAIAFDKTGTLTKGKPTLTGVYPLNGSEEKELLEVVIAVEKLSDHPLAAAMVKGAVDKLGNDVPAAAHVSAIQGRGIRADYNGTEIYIGNAALFTGKHDKLPQEILSRVANLEELGNTTMLVQQNAKFIGIITLMDVARSDAKETLAQLKNAGIRKMIMLTGDNQRVAEAIAKEIGITTAVGNLLPEQKVQAIAKLRKEEKKVAMVGDGVNDAPAMAKSTVGIAMGAAGSDVALETADIALMADELANLPFAIGLSKKARSIIRQNLIISLGMVAVLIPLTISGMAHIGPAVIGHEGSTLLVVFNGLRLLAYAK